MEAGLLYDPGVEELLSVQSPLGEKLRDFNDLRPLQFEEQQRLMKEMFAECGENVFIQRPLYANWGGSHVHMGSNIYANFNLTLTDDTHIYIDDNVMIAPNVVLATAAHPLDPEGRKLFLQKNAPIHICKNVWIGAGVIVLPGVTIGESTTIGSPCRVIRPLTEADKAWRENTYGI